jgi:hypothetical protein
MRLEEIFDKLKIALERMDKDYCKLSTLDYDNIEGLDQLKIF